MEEDAKTIATLAKKLQVLALPLVLSLSLSLF